MSGEKTFKPFHFGGNFSAEQFRHFFVHCAKQDVSDIIIQGGDFVWVELHGRQIVASTTRIQDGALPELLQGLWGGDVEIQVRGGNDQDRLLEISGESYGLERGEYLRFRTNIVQAQVARQPNTLAITMRIIPSSLPTFDTVHLEEEIKQEIYPRDGLVLVCGPTGSGKTTLMTAIYHHSGVNFPDRKVITFEDPIEFVLGGDHWKGPQPAQSQVGRDVPSFAAGLRNAMRRAPKIVGIGESRDLETFMAMVAVATSGHTCYATLHTQSCGEAVSRIIQAFPPIQQPSIAADLLQVLRVIIVQNLIKSLDGRRVVVREHFIITPEIRRELQDISHDQWGKYIQRKMTDQKSTLIDAAWELFKNGVISKEEFISKSGFADYKKRSEP
jgi:defect-in-organelle-trafficking protein DotB